MNQAQEILQSMAERLATSASVKQVFGEPVERGGRTVIPVARVQYRLGGGYGGGEQEGGAVNRPLAAGGGGGGGMVKAKPAGALEITDAGVRFIRFIDPVDMVKACVGGLVAVMLLRRLMR
ncbi:MAG: spore germination protein GerW family protein [Candidatus Korobacteraceae bacterium]